MQRGADHRSAKMVETALHGVALDVVDAEATDVVNFGARQQALVSAREVITRSHHQRTVALAIRATNAIAAGASRATRNGAFTREIQCNPSVGIPATHSVSHIVGKGAELEGGTL